MQVAIRIPPPPLPGGLLDGLTCTRSQLGVRQLWSVRPCPTLPQEAIDFKELLSEVIARAVAGRNVKQCSIGE